MKRTTKIKSALATAILCSLMTTVYAAPEQQDLTITGSMQTTSADSFTGEVPAMHYLDNGYVKNADGTYSKINASMTNGRPLMVNNSFNDKASSDMLTNGFKQYWGMQSNVANNIINSLKKLDVITKTEFNCDSITIRFTDDGVAKEGNVFFFSTHCPPICKCCNEFIKGNNR